MARNDEYEDFQNMIFEELDALERAADRPMYEITFKVPEEWVRKAAARGFDWPRESTLRVPEADLLRIERDRTKWPETVKKIFDRGLSVLESRARQTEKRRKDPTSRP